MNEDTTFRPLADHAGRETWTVNLDSHVVSLPVALGDVLWGNREADSLVLELADGQSLLVQDFFKNNLIGDRTIVVGDGNGGSVLLQIADSGHIAFQKPISRNRLDEMFDAELPQLAGGSALSKDTVDYGSYDLSQAGAAVDLPPYPSLDDASFLTLQPFSAAGVVGDGDSGGGWLDTIPGGGWTLLGGAMLVVAGVAAAGGDDDEKVESSADALGRILADPDSLTVERASIAVLDGVKEDNLNSLRTVLNAELDPAHGALVGLENEDSVVQRQRLQALIDTVNEVVDSSQGELVLAAEAGSLRLDIDSPADGTGDVDRVVYLLHDDNLLPSEIRFAADSTRSPVNVAAIAESPEDLSQYHRIEKLEYDQNYNVVSRTVDDSGTAGVAADGSIDIFERYSAPGPDYDDGVAGITDPNLLLSVETRTYEDINSDGTVDRLVYIEYDGDEYADSAADGTVDRRDTYVYSASADTSPDRIEVDGDNDGKVDGMIEYQYDANGRLGSVDSDLDNNGTANERRQYDYDSDGTLVRERISENTDDAGSFDVVSTLYFDGTGEDHDYTVFDGIASEDQADGTVDRLKFVDGTVFSLTMTDALAQELVGLKTIEMADDAAGNEGASTFAISDSQLTTMANGEQGYELTIDGGSTDEVQFAGNAIYRTGLRDDSGRNEFQGTGGKIFVGSTVMVSGVMDPLEALLIYLDEATVEMFELAGVSGVSADILANVKAAVGAYSADTTPTLMSLTAEQVGVLAETVSDLLRSGEIIGTASAASGGILLLEINEDSDAAFERSVEIAQDAATLQPTSVTISLDVNDDGTYERFEVDSNADGTVDSSGTLVRDGGIVIAMLHDEENDGTPDRLVFVDDMDRTYAIETSDALDYEGLASIRLAGGTGSTRLLITDAALAALAGDIIDYQLVITGGQDDAVIIGDEALLDGGTDEAGQQIYTGTSGRILIQTGIEIVESSLSALQEILQNPSAAGNDAEKYAIAGIAGVTAANLSSVQTLLEAWDDTTTPARASLTLQQVLALAGIVVNGEIVPVGGTVSSAMYAQGTGGLASRLSLRVDTDGAPGDEREVVIDLNDITLAPTAVSLREDTDGDGSFNNRISDDSDVDGNYETVMTDSDGDGAVESTAYDVDGDGTVDRIAHDSNEDGTVERTVTDSNDDGTFDVMVFTDDIELEYTLGTDEAADIAGLGGITLAGGIDGSTTLVITDAGLTALAGGETGYTLEITGDANDTVFLDGAGFESAGTEAGTGRRIIDGTDGRILFHVGLGSIESPIIALQEILRSPSAAGNDAEKYALAGIAGVTAANLPSVQTLLEAWDDTTTPARASFTLQQVLALAGIVVNGEIIPVGATVSSAMYAQGTGGSASRLTLRVDTDGAPGDEREVVIDLNDETLAPTAVSLREDTDGDGSFNNRISEDSDVDGNYETVMTDSDGDGAVESTAYDVDGDGTVDRIAHDSNEDGTVERTVTDSNDDGTFDVMVFTDDIELEYTLGTDEAADIAGLGGITLAGGIDGATTLVISDAALTSLAGGETGYTLAITGDADDTVLLDGAGFESAGTEAGTGRRIIDGTDGRILLHVGIGTIEIPFIALQEILQNPSAAGNDAEKYALAGIAGVTAANLSSVQTLLEAWDDTTTPARTSLTLQQVLALAGIVVNGEIVPVGGTVSSAMYAQGTGGSASRLTLRVDTDGAPGDEREVVIDLNDETFAPTAVSLREDTDGDGSFNNRISEDSDVDGNYETVMADSNGDGTVERTVTDSNDDGTFDVMVFTDDIELEYTLGTDEAAAIAGLGGITLAGGIDGATTLVLSDAGLTALAGGETGYTLEITGDANDTVFLDGAGFESAGTEAGTGRQIIDGTNGRILFHASIGSIESPFIALQEILANPSAVDNDVAKYQLAGLSEVTSDNLANVQTVLEAWDATTSPMRASLSLEQLNSLVGAVVDEMIVPSGATISSAVYAAGTGAGATEPSLTLQLEVPGDGGGASTYRRTVIDLDAVFGPASVSVQTYNNENFDRITRVWHDQNYDGTAERIDIDTDGDGTLDIFIHDSANRANDGTPDRLEIADGLATTVTLSGETLAAVTGISRIDMAGSDGTTDGASRLVITDAALTALAGSSENYNLVIDGSVNDVIRISGGGSNRIESGDDARDENNRIGYQWTSGKMYVGSDTESLVEYYIAVEAIDSVETDTNDDGTNDRLDRDTDGDGTHDMREFYNFDSEGNLVYRVIDEGIDGSMDRVKFEDGVTYSLDLSVETATEWAGVNRIDLASGVGGETTLTLSREAWVALGNEDVDYILDVVGESNDTVRMPLSSFAGPFTAGFPNGFEKYYLGVSPLSDGNERIAIDPDINLVDIST